LDAIGPIIVICGDRIADNPHLRRIGHEIDAFIVHLQRRRLRGVQDQATREKNPILKRPTSSTRLDIADNGTVLVLCGECQRVCPDVGVGAVPELHNSYEVIANARHVLAHVALARQVTRKEGNISRLAEAQVSCFHNVQHGGVPIRASSHACEPAKPRVCPGRKVVKVAIVVEDAVVAVTNSSTSDRADIGDSASVDAGDVKNV